MTPDPGTDYAPLPIRPPQAAITRRDDGSILIAQNYAMPDPWPSIPHLFAERAKAHPDRAFVARREALPDGRRGDWQSLSYGDALAKSRRLAQAMIDLGIGPDASVMVLSGASADHMVVGLAAQMARAPYAPLSGNHSLMSSDFVRLRHAFDLCRPRFVFADDVIAFRPALDALAADGVILVTSEAASDGFTIGLDSLLQTEAGPAVDASIAAITPDTHAKTIFTSGSTGRPKAAIQTQRMMTAIIAQHDALYIRDSDWGRGDAYLSWLPWSHVGPSNVMIGDVINDGATLYIDDGRPIPGQFDETIRNLREIHPVEFGSAPIFFAHLVGAMEADTALRDGFFKRLRYLAYSTAGLSQDLFDRLQACSIAATGRKIPIITKYGSTETQGMTLTSWPIEEIGPIGLPFPGITLKLAPVGNRLEICAKGDTVTPGYLHDPKATAAAFDDEGFYHTGDAGMLVDPARPERGIAFDGRVSENFKLASGTWVAVGPLRVELIKALAPVVQDVVITGENREYLGAMLWLRPGEASGVAGATGNDAELAAHPALIAHLHDALTAHNARAGGSSRRIARLLVLATPPIGDEIADKGYVNQREVQRRRTDEVERLYERQAGAGVIVAPAAPSA